jgi:hypothetical protein
LPGNGLPRGLQPICTQQQDTPRVALNTSAVWLAGPRRSSLSLPKPKSGG